MYGVSRDDELSGPLPRSGFYNIDEAAKYLNLSVREFQRLVIVGEIGKFTDLQFADQAENDEEVYWTRDTLDKYLAKFRVT
jgi:hypothetical protein